MQPLTPRWYPLRWHREFLRLWHSPARFKVVPAGRRSGKTELAKRRLVWAGMLEAEPWPDARFFAAAPTRDQAKAIYWDDLKRLVPERWMNGPPRESELSIRLINGASIWVLGMDRPERIEGRPWNGGVLDEVANMRPGAWGANVRPALSDRSGWCWLIGVPEGRNFYHELYQRAIADRREWDGFTWHSELVLPPAEIEAAKRDLDELTFEQEYRASFLSFSGRAYYPFHEATHCAPLGYDARAPLLVGLDFNVDPGVACVAQDQRLPNGLDGLAVIGEVWIPRNSNTERVCNKLIADWGAHEGRVIVYGDATGGARGSAKVAGSDWEIVKATLRPHFRDRLSLDVPPANPPERARVNAMNTRLRSAAGEIRLMVDPVKAPHVVGDLEGVVLLEGGSGELDKKATPELSHISDGLGYLVVKRHPLIGRVYQSATVEGDSELEGEDSPFAATSAPAPWR